MSPLTQVALERTFGVELELIGAFGLGDRLVRALRAERRDDGLLACAFGCWRSVHEPSLHLSETYPCGCELVSPTLHYGRSLDRAKVTGFVRALGRAGAAVNDSCGLHVHVGVGEAAKEADFLLSALALAYEWSRVLHALLRDRRVNSQFCEVHTAWLTAPVAHFFTGTERATYAKLMRLILERTSVKVTRDDKLDLPRDRALNLTALALYGTIEYRLFESTLDPDLVLAYVELCVRFTALIITTAPKLNEQRAPTEANVRSLLDMLEVSSTTRDLLWTAEVREHLRRLHARPQVRLPDMDLGMLDARSRHLVEEVVAHYR